jgi:acyl-CoA thioesterase-1
MPAAYESHGDVLNRDHAAFQCDRSVFDTEVYYTVRNVDTGVFERSVRIGGLMSQYGERDTRRYHGPWASLCLMLCLMISACEPSAERSSSSPPETGESSGPRDGFGSRLGTDVTAQPGRSREQQRDEVPKIVAFGDSLTAGAGVTPEESYPVQLQRRLDKAGYRYRVVNAGVSGDTTAGGVRRVDWILKSRPELVIVELGANDGLRGLAIDHARANLEEIIRRLQAAGVKVVLAGMKLPPNYGADYTARFAAMYEELSNKYRLIAMPFFLEGVGGQAKLNQTDGIHPTGAGYRIIVDNLMPVLEPLLSKAPVAG